MSLAAQLGIDGENLYIKTIEYLKAGNMPSDSMAATEFILAKLGELVDNLEDRDGLRTQSRR